MPICGISGCSNRPGVSKDVSFFKLPKVITGQCERTRILSEERRRVWKAAINRADIQTEEKWNRTIICSKHFVGGIKAYVLDRANPSWSPTLFLGSGRSPNVATQSVADRYKRASGRKEKKEKQQQAGGITPRRNYCHTIVKMEIEEESCRIKEEDTEQQIGEAASRRNYARGNYCHTIVKMEFEEESCRIKDEDIEQQIDPVDVKDLKHEFRRPRETNEDGNIFLHTEKNCVKKNVAKTGVKGSFTCSQCGKSFTEKASLKRHMRIHTGEKPFTCSQCGKSFTQKGSLNSHMRIHTREKPFTCTQCGKSFIHKESLNFHLRSHTGVRPYTCAQCGKSFIQKGHFNEHMRIHSGEKPFTCTQCGKSFTFRSARNNHLRRHSRAVQL